MSSHLLGQGHEHLQGGEGIIRTAEVLIGVYHIQETATREDSDVVTAEKEVTAEMEDSGASAPPKK